MERVQGEVWLYPCFPSSRVAQCTAHTHRPLWPVISSAEDNKNVQVPNFLCWAGCSQWSPFFLLALEALSPKLNIHNIVAKRMGGTRAYNMQKGHKSTHHHSWQLTEYCYLS